MATTESLQEEFKFPPEEYRLLCTYAKEGRLKDLTELIDSFSNKRFGPSTFSPDPTSHFFSPIVLAAQYGHIEIIKYFLETYSEIIDINRGASILSKTQQIKTHHVTPLIAACTNGNLELIRYLVSKKADIHKQSLTLATPLRAAAYYGYIEVMEFLINEGANINTPNCIGSTPLLAAAHSGTREAVKFLLDRGADTNQRTIENYTVVHEAAHKGEPDVVWLLLESGLSPMFCEPNPTNIDYVPCPLYLAAATGRRKIVEIFFEQDDCPVQCKADAYLLLATAILEYPDVHQSSNETPVELLCKGLDMMEQNKLKPFYLPSRPEYGNRVEICSSNELLALSSRPEFGTLEIYFQSLLIRERCLGSVDQSLIESLIRRGMEFLSNGYHKEAECLWERAMQVEESICKMECSHPQYGYSDGIMKDLEGDLQDYINGIHHILVVNQAINNYIPNFRRYAQFGIRALGYLDQLKTKCDAEVVNNSNMILLIIQLFCMWLSFSSASFDVSLCRDFVSSYLYQPPGSTLLLQACNMEWNVSTNVLLLKTFFDCGADCVIDIPNSDGYRPLHIAMKHYHDDSILKIFVSYGVHIDAVSADGSTIYNILGSETSPYLNSLGPCSLMCCSSRVIVKESLFYTNLPKHIVKFVKLHDPACVPVIKKR